MDIWYCFDKNTGEYAGNGLQQINSDEIGSTLIPIPLESQVTYYYFWDEASESWTRREVPGPSTTANGAP